MCGGGSSFFPFSVRLENIRCFIDNCQCSLCDISICIHIYTRTHVSYTIILAASSIVIIARINLQALFVCVHIFMYMGIYVFACIL